VKFRPTISEKLSLGAYTSARKALDLVAYELPVGSYDLVASIPPNLESKLPPPLPEASSPSLPPAAIKTFRGKCSADVKMHYINKKNIIPLYFSLGAG